MSCLRTVKVRRAVAAAEAEDAAASRMAKTVLRNRIPAKNEKKSETAWFPTLNFEAFSISAILRILKLINASKTHFSINNSKSYYKMRKTLFFWFVQFHTVLEVYEPQTLV